MKFVVRGSLLAACAVLGVVAAAFIAEHVPAAVSGSAAISGNTMSQACPAIHADVMLVTIQLQQPLAHQPEPVRALADAPLPP
ncbi:MAG TPA: hypothetical protein VHV55_06710 [Pirellulales bacterium]|jgi:hypothetical protein|nr:hypothetical protein [Pirellulales bacterium]